MDKLHKNYDYMYNAYKIKRMSIMDISNELRISKKLVAIWLSNHGLV